MTVPSIYLEANVLIDMAEHRDNSSPGPSANIWFCRQALRAARAGDVRVFTSIISVAECTSVAPGLPRPPDDVKRFFETLLMSGKSGVTLVGLTQSIAVRARDLRWNFGVNLKGADCIHVATAIASGCEEIWSRDGGIHKNQDLLKELRITATLPMSTQLLPQEYLQDDLIPLSN